MTATLEGVEAKVRRAEEHRARFTSEFREWVESASDRFIAHLDFEVRRLHLTYPPPPVSLINDLAAIAGDCVHNLRSVLDHLAWQLVLANGGTPGYRTSFPLLGEPPACRECGADQPVEIHGGVHPEALAIVQAVQPFQGEFWWRNLRHLKRMDDRDKHRTLHVITGYFNTMLWGHDPANPPAEVPLVLTGWEDADAKLEPAPGAQIAGEVRFYLALAEHRPGADGARVAMVLEEMQTEVLALVSLLAPFVDRPPAAAPEQSWPETHQC